MKGRYKIGDIAKLLDLPAQNIRFYEEKGILTPEKNQENGYRSYGAWNLNDLIDTMRYRGMDFSLGQIEEILKKENLDQICREYMNKETEILRKIQRYQNILETLSKERVRIQNLRLFTGRFERCLSPALIVQRHRKKNVFQTMNGSEDFNEIRENLKVWLDIIPEAIPFFIVSLSSLKEKALSDVEYWYGFSAETEYALAHGIEPVYPNEAMPVSRCVYTIFEAYEEGSFIDAFYQQVYKKVLEEGYVINGDPFGRLITKSHEDESFIRYFETWIPVVY